MQLIKPSIKQPKIVRMNLFILTILGLAIVLGFLFVGGLTPGENFKLTKYSDTAFYTPSNSNQQVENQRGLQLSLIKLENCSSTVAVDFLVDRSGSMGFNEGKKITNLRNAILSFKNKLTDQSIIGLQAFSSTAAYSADWNGICNPGDLPWCNLIAPSYYKDVKNSIHKTVCGLTASGATFTRDAFAETEKVLSDAKQKYPNYKFALIFISDGIPEDATNKACPGGIGGQWCGADESGRCRCYATDQDPTNYYDSTKVDITKQIKDMGITIFTISYVDKTDSHLNSLLQGLMERIATSKEYYYPAPDETKIKEILDQIANKICQESQ
jgi:hypothetical protein